MTKLRTNGPKKWEFGVEGDVVIAKNPYKRKTESIEDPNELVQDALDYLKKGDYKATLEYSDKAIKIKPTFALAYNIKDQALFSLRQYEEALISYDKTLELRPKDIDAINNKGLVYAAIGDYNKAVKCFNQSTDINPSDASIWNYKGLAFHALRKYEDAIVSYDKAIILRHTFVDAINNRESSKIQIKKQQQEEQQKQQEEQQKQQEEQQKQQEQPGVEPKSPYRQNRNNLKILIPVVVGIIGVVNAVIIFGNGMHQPPVQNSSSPTANNQSVTVAQNIPQNITLGGADPNPNAILTAHITSPPSHGTLSNIDESSIKPGVVTYTPYPGLTGYDSFTFKVNDGKVDSNNGTVSINIVPR